MKLAVQPGSPLHGTAVLPGDKSLSHRAALFAALAEGESRIENFLVAGVTKAMLRSLSAFGVSWSLKGDQLNIQGAGLHGFHQPDSPLDCGNSATTLRILAGALAAAGTPTILDGSPGLRRRPMRRIIEPLQRMGVPVEATAEGTAPLRLSARPANLVLNSMAYAQPVASAQVKSCLLLAALAAGGPTTISEPAPSRDHTERMLASMGVSLTSWQESGSFLVRITPPDQPLQPLRLRLPADISSAAFLIVAALITPGSEVTLPGVGLNPTRTGLLDALQSMGADLQVTPSGEQAGEPVGTIQARYSHLQGTTISGPLVVRMIDEFPAFAVAAVYAQGETLVYDAAELRHKESDRIASLAHELRQLGAAVDETPDGFRVLGRQPLLGGVVDPHGDHRLAMALAVAGLASTNSVAVQGADIIQESFPSFAPTLQALGARIQEK